MKGININCKNQDFIGQIISGIKTIETREKPSLRPYVGKTVGLVKTGCGKAMLYGYADITEEIHYTTRESFQADYKKHLVSAGSEYDINTEKYGYVLKNIIRIYPFEVESKGIVSREVPVLIPFFVEKQTTFEKVVAAIAENFRTTMEEESFGSFTEMKNCYGWNKQDIVNEMQYIVTESGFGCMEENGELYTNDDEIISYRKIINAVKKILK